MSLREDAGQCVHFGHWGFGSRIKISCHRTVTLDIVASLRLLLRMGHYMFVTEEEAAEIYAKACRSWYRDEAKSVVDSKIRALKAKGDSKGVKAWTQVRRSLESQEQSLF